MVKRADRTIMVGIGIMFMLMSFAMGPSQVVSNAPVQIGPAVQFIAMEIGAIFAMLAYFMGSLKRD